MKTTALSTTLFFVLTVSGVALADHGRYRRMDDLAFSALVNARELRWEIHDNFVDSADYNLLLRNADELAEELRHINAAIWAERPDSVICREIDAARRELTRLAARLDACDFACSRPAVYTPIRGGRGYAFAPATHHAGFRHVSSIRLMLVTIDTNLCAIHDELAGGHLVPYAVPVPAPVHPGYGTPFDSHGSPRYRDSAPPVLPAPVSGSGRSRSFEIPILGGRSGVVLKLDR